MINFTQKNGSFHGFAKVLAMFLCICISIFCILTQPNPDQAFFETELIEPELDEEKSSESLLSAQIPWEDGDDYLHPSLSTPFGTQTGIIHLLSTRFFAPEESPQIILPPPEVA